MSCPGYFFPPLIFHFHIYFISFGSMNILLCLSRGKT